MGSKTTKLLLLDSLLQEIFTMSVFESYWANKAACDDAERAYYEKLSGCKSAPADEALAAKKGGGSASEEESAKNPGAFKNAANGERTFIMCKPDAVQRGLVGEIMERFERRGFRLLCAKMMHAPDSLLKEHYADLSKKRITEERLKAYHEKKSKKPQVIAKTSVLLDVKPWDDETDHDAMLASVKSIEMDGLLWGAHKLIPIGYGIKKLQVMCTVEDEKVSVEELTEKIEEFEDFVQSCDVNAMNKI